VGFVVDKVTLGQVFSQYFGFPCQSSFHQFFSTITLTYHLGLVQYASKWPQYPKSHRTNYKKKPQNTKQKTVQPRRLRSNGT
jgi:hypothetical protein